MARYVLDTGVLIGILRAAPYAEYINKKFSPLGPPNITAISVVTVAELRSLALQFRWGETKRNALDELVRRIPIVDINNEDILNRYAEIDAYSLGKDPSRPLPEGMTAKRMGKNDIWIAATASVIRATLITIDRGFEHLNSIFLPVIYVDEKMKA
jgi:tRNA(fMet)-specific endonuclease VapC